MSIELPEAYILGNQMKEELIGKTVVKCQMTDYEKAQKIGFINENIDDFQQLEGKTIEEVEIKGTMITIKFTEAMNLVIAPEYGGKYFIHESSDQFPKKYTIKIVFSDGTLFSGRLSGMGALKALNNQQLETSYMYKREYSGKLSPMDGEFSFEHFSTSLKNKNRQLKSVLVGKDAEFIGLMNSAFQDILYRAKIHPKRKASSLNDQQLLALYSAIKDLVSERLDKHGKVEFLDLYQKSGKYNAKMGPNMKNMDCEKCGCPIESISHGGGKVFLCQTCQV
ncbi:MAG: DNA-formamidopyrimidine glycosylase family protein [Candidatus Kariarchaeaceae archaeon]|jgi:formamidopyrimidine-DNA glycosylase